MELETCTHAAAVTRPAAAHSPRPQAGGGLNSGRAKETKSAVRPPEGRAPDTAQSLPAFVPHRQSRFMLCLTRTTDHPARCLTPLAHRPQATAPASRCSRNRPACRCFTPGFPPQPPQSTYLPLLSIPVWGHAKHPAGRADCHCKQATCSTHSNYFRIVI
jgi:hypothetical protein